MPYSNIVYVKLFVELLDKDDRFLYQLNESQQLLYLKMLMMAGKTLNKIPKTFSFIRNTINYAHEESCFKADIARIQTVFPKLKEDDNIYYFEKFEELHNYIDKDYIKSKKNKAKDDLGETSELPTETPEEEIRNKKENKNKNKNKKEETIPDKTVVINFEDNTKEQPFIDRKEKVVDVPPTVPPPPSQNGEVKDGDVVKITGIKNYFISKYKEDRGIDYIWNFKKDGALMKGFLNIIPEKEMYSIIDYYFSMKDSFTISNAYSVGCMWMKINFIRQEINKLKSTTQNPTAWR